jgi:hypothetical protein
MNAARRGGARVFAELWHVNCKQLRRSDSMARKTKIGKLVKAVRISDRTLIRRTLPKPAALYLIELRSHVAETHLLRRKLPVTTVGQNGHTSKPQRIKITRL